MRFGSIPLDEAEGAVLAHSLRQSDIVLKKGIRLTAEHISALRRTGISEIIAARLDPDDLDEDSAAARLAAAIAGAGTRIDPAATGRVNLFAQWPGLLSIDTGAVDRFNRIDESITVATLPAFRAVRAGEMVATVKIIPFAVPETRIAAAAGSVPEGGLVAVRPFRPKSIGVVSTLLPHTAEKMLAKTMRVLSERLDPAGAAVIEEIRVFHEARAVADALSQLKAKGAEILLVYGASAIADRSDVIPAAVGQAGGRIVHLGMPVDPGNLLLVAELGGTPVIGAPGCARSPKENGFDWVLQRLLSDVPVRPEDITGMGVGGLLMEIESRPQPREGVPERPRPQIAAVVLAAGRSRRMGGPNKLLERVGDRTLVRIAVEAALASGASEVVVVTGHQAGEIAQMLAGLNVTLVHNSDFAEGLSTSLRAGIEALPSTVDAALVCLADMPGITSIVLDRLIDAFDPDVGRLIVLPTFKGKRGNPVLWGRRFFPALAAIHGDVGARHLIGEHVGAVVEVEFDDSAVTRDIDTQAALRRLREAERS